MPHLHLVRDTTAPPSAVWRVVTDFAGYDRWMPFTRMRTDAGTPRVGWGFTGVTGFGRLSFADSMLITEWVPPTAGAGRFRVVKTGRLLGGWVQVDVEPRADGARLHWRVGLVVRPLGRLFAPAVDRAARWAYGRAVEAMTAHAEAGGSG
jgi:uncharacterized protein YndB with AHSA1/START domain